MWLSDRYRNIKRLLQQASVKQSAQFTHPERIATAICYIEQALDHPLGDQRLFAAGFRRVWLATALRKCRTARRSRVAPACFASPAPAVPTRPAHLHAASDAYRSTDTARRRSPPARSRWLPPRRCMLVVTCVPPQAKWCSAFACGVGASCRSAVVRLRPPATARSVHHVQVIIQQGKNADRADALSARCLSMRMEAG